MLIFVFFWAILASSETLAKTNTKENQMLADLFKENTNQIFIIRYMVHLQVWV